MLILFSAIIVILIYYLYQSNENREIEKQIHNREVSKFKKLQLYPNLNQSYLKIEVLCNKLKDSFLGSAVVDEKQFKYRITQSKYDSIYAQGYIMDKTHLSTDWRFNEVNNKINLYITLSKNHKTIMEKQMTFYSNDSDESILNSIREIIM